MRKILFTLLLVILLTTVASADIIITQQPQKLYNSGDVINVPVKITTTDSINDFFLMLLICSGKQTEMHREYVSITAGEEVEINPKFPLTTSFVGKSVGSCKIKAMLGEDYILTDTFEISNKINIELTKGPGEAAPGDTLLIEGEAKKENGEFVNGFVDFKILKDGVAAVDVLNTVKAGQFSINLTLPGDMKAGQSLVKIEIYEKDIDGEITNNGFVDYNMKVQQIPTSLEIAFDNQEVKPGTNLRVKAILHDQSGEPIDSVAIISIKNANGKVLEQTEKTTGEFLEFYVEKDQTPEEWEVVALSNKISSESKVSITENKEVQIELSNKTLIVTNVGNVPYEDSLLIKIGEEPLNINVSLGIGKSARYVLSAPDGEYTVEIISGEESYTSEGVLLTGDAINIKKAGEGIVKIARHPLAWVFIILVLAVIAFIIFKKGYKKSFIGYIHNKKLKNDPVPLRKNSIVQSQNPAHLSLSIKGDKQNTSLICLRIKNLNSLQSKDGNAEETLQKIVKMAEQEKAATYENQNNIFFILAPTKTKTFSNEMSAINIAQQMKKALDHHNKLFKQKIDFGISINYGSIIAQQEPTSLKFMSMGTLVTTAKKIASHSEGEILLSEKMREKVLKEVKTEKHMKGHIPVFTITEIKHHSANKKFISNFIERLEHKDTKDKKKN